MNIFVISTQNKQAIYFMKFNALICCAILTVFFSACKKTDHTDSPLNSLENTSWTPALTDNDPDRNNNEGNLYYPWLECGMDDVYTFGKTDFQLMETGTSCHDSNLWSSFRNQPYSYNQEQQQLTIGTGAQTVLFQVLELNKDRLKLSQPMSQGKSMLFIFQRK